MSDTYSIKTVIKGKKYTLNKVGEFPQTGDDMMTAIMMQGYVAENFREVCTSVKDVEKIDYFDGKKKIASFKYPLKYGGMTF